MKKIFFLFAFATLHFVNAQTSLLEFNIAKKNTGNVSNGNLVYTTKNVSTYKQFMNDTVMFEKQDESIMLKMPSLGLQGILSHIESHPETNELGTDFILFTKINGKTIPLSCKFIQRKYDSRVAINLLILFHDSKNTFVELEGISNQITIIDLPNN